VFTKFIVFYETCIFSVCISLNSFSGHTINVLWILNGYTNMEKNIFSHFFLYFWDMIYLKSLTNRSRFRPNALWNQCDTTSCFTLNSKIWFHCYLFQRNNSDLRGKVPNCSIAFEQRLCLLCRPQRVMNTLKKVRSGSLLLRTYCTFTVFFKNECYSPPQGCQKKLIFEFWPETFHRDGP
jgi:hypothetical protein